MRAHFALTSLLASGAYATAVNYAQWQVYGCVSDLTSWGARSLPNQITTITSMTNEACVTACWNAGYTMAGTEYGNECWCGTAIVNGGQLTSSSLSGENCNVACAGNSKETCGGPSRLSVYKYVGPALSSTTTTTSKTTTTTSKTTTTTTTTKPTTTTTTTKPTTTTTTTTKPITTTTTTTTTKPTTTTPTTTTTTTTKTTSTTTTAPTTTTTTTTTSKTTTSQSSSSSSSNSVASSSAKTSTSSAGTTSSSASTSTTTSSTTTSTTTASSTTTTSNAVTSSSTPSSTTTTTSLPTTTSTTSVSSASTMSSASTSSVSSSISSSTSSTSSAASSSSTTSSATTSATTIITTTVSTSSTTSTSSAMSSTASSTFVTSYVTSSSSSSTTASSATSSTSTSTSSSSTSLSSFSSTGTTLSTMITSYVSSSSTSVVTSTTTSTTTTTSAASTANPMVAKSYVVMGNQTSGNMPNTYRDGGWESQIGSDYYQIYADTMHCASADPSGTCLFLGSNTIAAASSNPMVVTDMVGTALAAQLCSSGSDVSRLRVTNAIPLGSTTSIAYHSNLSTTATATSANGAELGAGAVQITYSGSGVPTCAPVTGLSWDATQEPLWGSGGSVSGQNDNYNYLMGYLGVLAPGYSNGNMYAARVTKSSPTTQSTYQYWNGTAWTSTRLINPNSYTTSPAVIPGISGGSIFWSAYYNKYVYLTSSPFTGAIFANTADNPSGPWSAKNTIFQGSLNIYGPVAQPHFDASGKTLVVDVGVYPYGYSETIQITFV